MHPATEFDRVRGDDVIPDKQLWTVSGAADFVNLTPEQAREVMQAAGVHFVMSIDDVGLLDDAGLIRIIQHLHNNAAVARELEGATCETIDAVMRQGSFKALLEDDQIGTDWSEDAS